MALIISAVQTEVFSGRRNGNAPEGRKRRPFRGSACVFCPLGGLRAAQGYRQHTPTGWVFEIVTDPTAQAVGYRQGALMGPLFHAVGYPQDAPMGPLFQPLATDSAPLTGWVFEIVTDPTAQAVGYRQDAPTGWEEPRQGFHVGSQG